MRCRVHHVGKDAKVLQSSLCVLHPTMKNYPTTHRGLRCTFLGLSTSSWMELSRPFYKTSGCGLSHIWLVLVPPSTCCHTHIQGTPPALYDASVRRSLRIFCRCWYIFILQLVFPTRPKYFRTVNLFVFFPKRGTAVTPLFATALPPPT